MTSALTALAATPGGGHVEHLDLLIPFLDTDQFRLAAAIAEGAEGADRERAETTLARHPTDDARVEMVERAGNPVATARARVSRRERPPPSSTACCWRRPGAPSPLSAISRRGSVSRSSCSA